jgi:hypothetical protein
MQIAPNFVQTARVTCRLSSDQSLLENGALSRADYRDEACVVGDELGLAVADQLVSAANGHRPREPDTDTVQHDELRGSPRARLCS